jgi:hypothetical protein
MDYPPQATYEWEYVDGEPQMRAGPYFLYANQDEDGWWGFIEDERLGEGAEPVWESEEPDDNSFYLCKYMAQDVLPSLPDFPGFA